MSDTPTSDTPASDEDTLPPDAEESAEEAGAGDDEPERESAVGVETSASGVGALLRASRNRCGEDLRDVANALRIRFVFLEAIENGRFEDLPGPTYAIGFVRAYADYLGLDAEEVVRRFKQEATPVTKERSRLSFPTPVSETGIPGGALIFVGVLVALIAYGAWYMSTSDDGLFDGLVSDVPERLAEGGSDTAAAKPEMPAAQAPAGMAEEAPADTLAEAAPETPAEPDTVSEPTAESGAAASREESASAPESEAVPEPAPETVVKTAEEKTEEMAEEKAEKTVADVAPAPEPAPAPDVAPEETPSAETPVEPPAAETPVSEAETPATEAAEAADGTEGDSQQVVLEGAVPDAPRVFGAPEGEIARIIVKATADSWVQVSDSVSGKLMLTRLLRAGDIYRVPDRKGLVLLTGNAGALEFLVDNEPVPSIGPVGAVRRDVALEPDRLMAGSATGN